MIRPPPDSPLFPYTTLFRSRAGRARREVLEVAERRRHDVQGARHFTTPPATAGVRSSPPIAARSGARAWPQDRKSTRLNSSHEWISYAVFCLKKKKATIMSL